MVSNEIEQVWSRRLQTATVFSHAAISARDPVEEATTLRPANSITAHQLSGSYLWTLQ
jgi:hypothetical protein